MVWYNVVAVVVVVTVKVYTMHWKFSKKDNDIYYLKKKKKRTTQTFMSRHYNDDSDDEDRNEIQQKIKEQHEHETRHTTRNIPNLVHAKFWLLLLLGSEVTSYQNVK